jgi:hypothetical protein
MFGSSFLAPELQWSFEREPFSLLYAWIVYILTMSPKRDCLHLTSGLGQLVGFTLLCPAQTLTRILTSLAIAQQLLSQAQDYLKAIVYICRVCPCAYLPRPSPSCNSEEVSAELGTGLWPEQCHRAQVRHPLSASLHVFMMKAGSSRRFG